MELKTIVLSFLGMLGSAIASAFGGWTAGLETLTIFMCIDYFTGFVVAGVFHKSTKSKNGALQSKAGWQGLCRKGMTLMFVMIAYRLDILTGSNYIKDAVIIGFCANELISIVENAGLMGLPVPKIMAKAIDILKNKAEGSIEK